MKVLVLNSGSSSQKSSLYEIGNALPEDPPQPIWQAKVEWSGEQTEIEICNLQGDNLKNRIQVDSRQQAIKELLDTLWTGKTRAISAPSDIAVVGHRVVHGGREYERPTVITPAVRDALARLSILAPLHNRAELEGMEIIEQRLGPIPQVAVFDTGFHSHLPEPAFVYPGPYEWLARGIRRYGFHGINHEYCAERAAQLLHADLPSLRIVTCHLGNGCSLAAIQNGHSVDTTMGFTPLEGLMMGSRSGSVDPGILTYLMRQDKLTGQQLDEELNARSGLLGISGISGDMRQVLAAIKGGDARAKLAFDIFIHRLRRNIGALVAVLGGIDAMIFTAGIGENSPEVRAAACENFEYLGLRLDRQKNGQFPKDREISASNSAVRVLVIHAQEDWAIAQECWRFCSEARCDRATARA